MTIAIAWDVKTTGQTNKSPDSKETVRSIEMLIKLTKSIKSKYTVQKTFILFKIQSKNNLPKIALKKLYFQKSLFGGPGL